MANPDHLSILKKGARAWNNWRNDEEDKPLTNEDEVLVFPDLSGADLSGLKLNRANLNQVNLSNANFTGCDLTEAMLIGTNLSGAHFEYTLCKETNFSLADFTDAIFKECFIYEAKFSSANFKNIDFQKIKCTKVDFKNANFEGANLQSAEILESNFTDANLSNANLSDADLAESLFIRTKLEGAILNRCKIYGTSVWDIEGTIKEQSDLIISNYGDAEITVDDLEVAQFIYLILKNEKIRNVIDSLTSKSVLILGRFYEERKNVLDALKKALREKDYLPILFDFKKPDSKDLTETIITLAQMSRFVIADITDAKSIPQELMAIVPHNPSLAIVPLIDQSFREYAMFEHLARYPWVLPLHEYESKTTLIDNILDIVIIPAEKKAAELRPIRRK